jgi:hypothetical protein
MIVSLRSRCMTCRHLVEGLGLASDTGRRGPMKDTVGVGKSFPFLGGRCTLSPHSFYLLCHNER